MRGVLLKYKPAVLIPSLFFTHLTYRLKSLQLNVVIQDTYLLYLFAFIMSHGMSDVQQDIIWSGTGRWHISWATLITKFAC